VGVVSEADWICWIVFARDIEPGAVRSHWTAQMGGSRAAQAGSPDCMVEMAVPVPRVKMAGSRVVAVGSKAAAGSVR